jgi:FdrA protein
MASDKDNASLLGSNLSVINVGLDKFATELADHGVPVVHLDWKPPAGGDPKLAALLSKMGT